MKLVFAVVLSLSLPAAAAESEDVADRPISSVSIELGTAGSGHGFGGVSADLGLPNGDIVSLSASSNREKDEQGREVSATKSFAAGYTFSPEGRYSVTPSFESWGARSDLVTRSALLDVTVNLAEWSFGVQPEVKTLVWASAIEPDRKIRTKAGGLHAHAAYVGLEDWMFLLKAGATGYGNERFDDFLYADYVTDSAFAQSSGLIKSYSTVIVSYNLAAWTFALNVGKAVFLVTDETSTSAGIQIGYQIQDQWTVGYNHTGSTVGGGKTHADAVNLAYAW